jgi:hypothetical protein
MFDSIEAFFFDGSDKLTVTEQRRRGIAVKRIETKNVHTLELRLYPGKHLSCCAPHSSKPACAASR